MYYIYITTNKVNGKKYIGQHKGSINDGYLGSGVLITRAIQKYGKENFSKEIIFTCETREEADKKEKEVIAFYNAIENKNFYNLQEGGTGGDGWRAYQRWVVENKDKMNIIYQKNYNKLKKWAEENPEEVKKNIISMHEGRRKWQKENREKVLEIMKKVNEGKLKWEEENPKKRKEQIEKFIKAGSIANSKQVICLTTKEVFSSVTEGAKKYGLQQSNLTPHLRGRKKSCGRHPVTNEKLIWQFVQK